MNNNSFNQELPGEIFSIEELENLPWISGEYQPVEVISPSKIYFCQACKLIFQCQGKLDSHKAKRGGCTFEESARSTVSECLGPTNQLD
jgi:hypothetical protein